MSRGYVKEKNIDLPMLFAIGVILTSDGVGATMPQIGGCMYASMSPRILTWAHCIKCEPLGKPTKIWCPFDKVPLDNLPDKSGIYCIFQSMPSGDNKPHYETIFIEKGNIAIGIAQCQKNQEYKDLLVTWAIIEDEGNDEAIRLAIECFLVEKLHPKKISPLLGKHHCQPGISIEVNSPFDDLISIEGGRDLFAENYKAY